MKCDEKTDHMLINGIFSFVWWAVCVTLRKDRKCDRANCPMSASAPELNDSSVNIPSVSE